MGNFFLIRWLGPWKHRLFVIGFLVDCYFCFGCSGYCCGCVFRGSGGISCSRWWVCCGTIMGGRWRGPIIVPGWGPITVTGRGTITVTGRGPIVLSGRGPITLIWWGRGIGIMNFYRFQVFYCFWCDIAVVQFWLAVII